MTQEHFLLWLSILGIPFIGFTAWKIRKLCYQHRLRADHQQYMRLLRNTHVRNILVRIRGEQITVHNGLQVDGVVCPVEFRSFPELGFSEIRIEEKFLKLIHQPGFDVPPEWYVNTFMAMFGGGS